MSSTSTCPACGAQAVVNGVCGRCGYAAGETNRCPHCNAVARATPRGAGAELSWVCAVCGGPRIPGNLGGDAALPALREAKAFLAGATRARATSIAWGILAVLATLVVVAATAKQAIAATVVLAVLAIVPAILALRARSRATAAGSAAAAAERRAWLAAAEDVARGEPSGVTAEELAKRLQIDEGRADRLLTELAVHERTRVDVGDDAEVRYSVSPRVRLGEEESIDEGEADEELRGRNA